RVTKISGWHQITNAADMKTWLSTRGPLAACFTVYNDFFSYRSGVYRHVTGGVAGGHCVSCGGYDRGEGLLMLHESGGTRRGADWHRARHGGWGGGSLGEWGGLRGGGGLRDLKERRGPRRGGGRVFLHRLRSVGYRRGHVGRRQHRRAGLAEQPPHPRSVDDR